MKLLLALAAGAFAATVLVLVALYHRPERTEPSNAWRDLERVDSV